MVLETASLQLAGCKDRRSGREERPSRQEEVASGTRRHLGRARLLGLLGPVLFAATPSPRVGNRRQPLPGAVSESH